MKKKVLFVVLIISLMGLCLAQEKMDISLMKESFSPDENISFRVSLLDEENNPIQAEVDILAQDAGKLSEVTSKVKSNEMVSLDLGKNMGSGYWRIIARYNDNEAVRIFSVESQELASFEIRGDHLVISNRGNVEYIKTIQIIIGDSVGTKDIALAVGKSTSFRLIAPNGAYNVRVSDGKTSVSKENVVLSGDVIGILDEKILEPSAITSGLNTEKSGFLESFKNNSIVYVFLILLICAFLLVIVERFYRRKAFGK